MDIGETPHWVAAMTAGAHTLALGTPHHLPTGDTGESVRSLELYDVNGPTNVLASLLVAHVGFAPHVEFARLQSQRNPNEEVPAANTVLVAAVRDWVAAHRALRRLVLDFSYVHCGYWNDARVEQNRDFNTALLTAVLGVVPPRLHRLHLRCTCELDARRLQALERSLGCITRDTPLHVTWDVFDVDKLDTAEVARSLLDRSLGHTALLRV